MLQVHQLCIYQKYLQISNNVKIILDPDTCDHSEGKFHEEEK